MKTGRRVGRPADPRPIRVMVRVDKDEHRRLQTAAEADARTVAGYLRHHGLRAADRDAS